MVKRLMPLMQLPIQAISRIQRVLQKLWIYFIKANNVGQYIAQNKWANIGKVDTTLVLNIAKAALNAKKNDTARKYFQEIADAHISGLHNENNTPDPSYELPYQWLTLDYKQAGDSANMVKYATIGKELYPKDDYYDFVEMDYYRENEDHADLLKSTMNLLQKILTAFVII